MPQTPDVDGDVLTADVGELRNPELANLASALARVAGWSTLTAGAALTLGTLASQAQQTLDRRRGAPRGSAGRGATRPDGPEAA